ncbi:MAG TPA: NADH-quinone oxidoreductase subunit C [Candidatus Dormibacteraeota bacterium]|nr:NADH-quinone oxidoreductase subunit C [Candidatus Dormibacteraeota bacterium]
MLQLQAGFGAGLEPSVDSDCVVVEVPPAQLQKFAAFVRDKLGFDLLTSITAVDRGPDFELLYHFVSVRPDGEGAVEPAYPGYLLMRVAVPRDLGVDPKLGDEPIVPSITSLYPGANQQEREVYDLMGIRFRGHPRLERILLWEGFPGHPLRKDWRPLNAEIPWHLAGMTGFGGLTMAEAPAVARIADDGTGVSQPIPLGTTPEAFQYPPSREPKPSEVMRIRIGQGGLIDGEGPEGPGFTPGVELPASARPARVASAQPPPDDVDGAGGANSGADGQGAADAGSPAGPPASAEGDA